MFNESKVGITQGIRKWEWRGGDCEVLEVQKVFLTLKILNNVDECTG